ncbi:MAG: DnaJ C-terminal domain-containing protein [Candidatus Margulisbacteria bacterium]|nr:DnaJ C-terminal domain-containing protein [Candidatus Margulisiibacteriota bacterium]
MDPYKILGVSKTSSDTEIKAAFRKLSKKYHPDLNAGNKDAEKKFKEINNAYELIKNKEARDRLEQENAQPNYQDYAQAGRQGPFYYETQTPGSRYGNYAQGDYEDFFDTLFKGSTTRGFSGNFEDQVEFPGQDIQYSMEITFKEAVLGVEKEIILAKGKHLKVKIPAGIESGTKLRFKGHGSKGMGRSKSGDAYVEVRVKNSPTFRKEGANLVLEVPVTINEAINGAKIEVPTIEGKVLLTIPAGVNSGTKLRMKGKGYYLRSTKNKGDQIVVIKIVLPEKIDPELKTFFENWSKKHSYNPRSHLNFQE